MKIQKELQTQALEKTEEVIINQAFRQRCRMSPNSLKYLYRGPIRNWEDRSIKAYNWTGIVT